jgi:succinate dehydrogenase/fumarate reductase-like Fe-S protein
MHRFQICRTIVNCSDACPKGPNPALVIGKIKAMKVRCATRVCARSRSTSQHPISAR